MGLEWFESGGVSTQPPSSDLKKVESGGKTVSYIKPGFNRNPDFSDLRSDFDRFHPPNRIFSPHTYGCSKT